MQKQLAVTDEQLTQCKLELRNVRRDNERLQLEYEEMNRRCNSALAERCTAVKQLNEVKDLWEQGASAFNDLVATLQFEWEERRRGSVH